jgi:LPS sulfotransferase NodH
MSNFIILGDARTGSSLLCEAFEAFNKIVNLDDLFAFNYFNLDSDYGMGANKHLNALFDFEKIELKKIINSKENIFHYDYHSNEAQHEAILSQYIHTHPKEFYESLIQSVNHDFVFKLHTYHFDTTELEWIFDLPDTYFILLNRDKLSQFVSHKIAMNTNTWKIKDTTNEKITVKTGEFLKFAKHNTLAYQRHYINQLEKRNINYLSLNYEKDFQDLEYLLIKIQNWANERGVNLSRNDKLFPKMLTKQSHAPLEVQITNYLQLERFLKKFSNLYKNG